MSVLSTTGAASLKRSGFISSENVLYNYYHTDTTGAIYGSSTMSGPKKLLKYDNGNLVTRINFIFAEDELIAGPYFGSATGGKSWPVWAQANVFGSGTTRGGLNGVGAYRPTDKSVVMGYVNWLGDNELDRGIKQIKADGTITTYNTFQSTGFYTFNGIAYSPALDAFFWYDSNDLIRVYDGASPGTQLSSGTIANLFYYGVSISSDGYPLVVNITNNPIVLTLRKVTDTNLSFTNLGTITDSQAFTQSTSFVWDATRSRYCKASYVGTNSGSGTLYFGYSSDGLTWTNSTIGTLVSGNSFLLLRGLTLFLDGSDLYVQGNLSSSEGASTFQRVSTDGGATWSVGGANGYSLSTKRIVT